MFVAPTSPYRSRYSQRFREEWTSSDANRTEELPTKEEGTAADLNPAKTLSTSNRSGEKSSNSSSSRRQFLRRRHAVEGEASTGVASSDDRSPPAREQGNNAEGEQEVPSASNAVPSNRHPTFSQKKLFRFGDNRSHTSPDSGRTQEDIETEKDLAALEQLEAGAVSLEQHEKRPPSLRGPSSPAEEPIPSPVDTHPPSSTHTPTVATAPGEAASSSAPTPTPTSSSSSSSSRPKGVFSSSRSPCRYVCDICPHLRFPTFEAAERHILEAHSDHIPDYQRLRTVVQQLREHRVWEAVRQQKMQEKLMQRCGERVMEEGSRKDPGPSRMSDAHRAREQLEAVVQQWHPTAKVFIFGSSVTFGIWDGMGDIDFTVVDEAQLRAGTWPPPERNAVRSITELLRRAGFSYVNLEPISHARVPIIKHHASFPLRLDPEVVLRSLQAERRADHRANGPSSTSSHDDDVDQQVEEELQARIHQRLEAEDVISRSVRYILNAPASWEDRVLLEASIREAVGPATVQQVWWNRTSDLLNVTLDTTTNAIRAATCPLAVVSPSLRARIQPLHDDCRPELYCIDFDLSFRVFGIRNSQLLRRYLMQHPCARPGAMVLKEWSKRSGVNNSVNGFLTSYAVAILWLYFLLQKNMVQFVDPVKDVPASLEGCPKNPLYVPMVDPKWTPEEQGRYTAQAGELLIEFFYFYAVEFDWQRHVVSLNRPGITTKAQLGWVEEEEPGSSPLGLHPGGGAVNEGLGSAPLSPAGGGSVPRRHTVRYNFCIEDPYEENLNLGRHMGLTKTLRVQSEFYRGLLSLLKDGARDVCVFPAPSTASARSQTAAAEEDELLEEGEVSASSVSSGGGASRPLPSTAIPAAPPLSLAQRVLYRLMAVSLREIAQSQRQHRAAAAPPLSDVTPPPSHGGTASENGSPVPTTGGSARWNGLPQQNLRAAMERAAPTELKVALKVWNWQQLVHRLGLKIHHDCVFPRREVGVKKALHTTSSNPNAPPEGVMPTHHARETLGLNSNEPTRTEGNTSDTTSSRGVTSTAEALRQLPSRGLAEELQIHLSKGFLGLTPEWVAWSEPWAASAILNAAATPTTTAPPASVVSSSSGGLKTTPTSMMRHYGSLVEPGPYVGSTPSALCASFRRYHYCGSSPPRASFLCAVLLRAACRGRK